MVMWRPMNLQCVLLDKMGIPTLVLTKTEEHSLNRHADSDYFMLKWLTWGGAVRVLWVQDSQDRFFPFSPTTLLDLLWLHLLPPSHLLHHIHTPECHQPAQYVSRVSVLPQIEPEKFPPAESRSRYSGH